MVWNPHKLSLLLGLVLTLVSASRAQSQDLVLLNAVVIDGTGVAPRPGVTIVVRDGKIAELTAETRAGAETIDLNGRFVLPGFIDAHNHILSPAAAERALLSGVTTARVLGIDISEVWGARSHSRRSRSRP